MALTNVTLRNNGRAGNGVTAGARLGGPGGTIARCVLNANFGAGVQVVAGSNGWTITRNAFSANGSISSSGGGVASGQIGIDLQAAGDLPASGSAPYVTRNDVGDADAGGNSLVNFPVLESAILGNGQFSLSGWARPGATIELYVSDGDPSGFGEGLTWLGTFTEGSPADLDAGSTAYAPPVNGLDQGSDATNRFRFTLPVPAGVASGVALTSTATLASAGTSSSPAALVATGSACRAWLRGPDHDAQRDAGEPASALALWAKPCRRRSTATQVAPLMAPALPVLVRLCRHPDRGAGRHERPAHPHRTCPRNGSARATRAVRCSRA